MKHLERLRTLQVFTNQSISIKSFEVFFCGSLIYSLYIGFRSNKLLACCRVHRDDFPLEVTLREGDVLGLGYVAKDGKYLKKWDAIFLTCNGVIIGNVEYLLLVAISYTI